MIPIMLVSLMILSGILISLSACKQNKNDPSDNESIKIDTTISVKDSETATIRIPSSNKVIRIETSGSTTINVENSGRTIRIQSSGTSSRSTIRIQKSGSRSNNWENPWDDSRWQDNKVPWLEHTQGYP